MTPGLTPWGMDLKGQLTRALTSLLLVWLLENWRWHIKNKGRGLLQEDFGNADRPALMDDPSRVGWSESQGVQKEDV